MKAQNGVERLIFKTSWGWVGLATSDRGLARVVLPRPSRRGVEAALNAWARRAARESANGSPRGSSLGRKPKASGRGRGAGLLRLAHTQVRAYLAGRRRGVRVPVDLSSGTPFQRKVWRVLGSVPFGRLHSYKWVATRIGGAHYARAVGTALGANPVPLVLPCHRIVAGDGSLGGFTGGVPIKRRLLALEGTLSQLRRYGKNG